MHRGVIRIVCAACALCLAISCMEVDRKHQKGPTPERRQALLPNRYGFIDSGLTVDTVTIPSGVALSSLLRQHGVQAHHAQQIDAGGLENVFSPRRMRAGNASYFWRDAEGAAHHWVYKHSPTAYMHVDFTRDTVQSVYGELPVTTRRRSVHTVIESSLWNAMAAANATPELALQLSDIFAWTVDFFGLSTGDQFFVNYDEQMLDTVRVGLGKIYAARYVHGKDTIGAYAFAQDSSSAYWDQNGRSLRKAFLKAPLHFSRISSHFSYGRMHPILKIVRPHTGVDYAAPAGTPVVALGDGVVVVKGFHGGGGNTVKIKHNSVYTTGYMHLSRYGKDIREGSRVQQGQIVGYVGSTGLATGPHLDFRVWRNGSPINPLQLESPPVAPLDSAQMPLFFKERALLDSLLDLAVGPTTLQTVDTARNSSGKEQ